MSIVRASSAPYLFAGTVLAAAGYGATFLFSAYFRHRGGSDVDTGLALGAAMLGTFAGVPLVGWVSGRIDAARLAGAAGCAMAGGFLVLGLAGGTGALAPRLAAFLIGLGWGMFYIGAPMALSERVGDAERGAWFTRFGAFQMAGIGGSPVVLGAVQGGLRLETAATFLIAAAATALSALLLTIFAGRAPPHPPTRAVRPWVSAIGALASGAALRPILMVGLGACVFSGLLSFQGSLVEGTRATASSFFAVYAVTVVGARLLLARALAGVPQRRLAVGLLTLMGLGVLAMFGVGFHPLFQVLSAVLTGLGYGLVYPVIQTWAVNRAPPALRHAALTWFVLAYFIGVFGFPVIGGWVLVRFGAGGLLTALLVAAGSELSLACLPERISDARAPYRT